MSPIRLTIAFSISIVLIGGAVWFRFGQTTYVSSNIIAVETSEPALSEETFLADFLATSTSISTKTTRAEPLSQIDLISRGLFSDYIALKSQGQATPNNINTLAGKYAESLAIQSIQTQQITLNQIIIVPDSKENLTLYGDNVINIRNKYKNLLITQYNKNTNLADPNSPAFSTFMSTAGKLYQSFADELLVTKVPVSLSKNHTDLINNYLVSARAMNMLSNISEDPTQIYVALNTQAKNSREEESFILNIQQTMMANGIIFNNGNNI